MLQGILLLDKPAGWTSFDVVNYVRRIVAERENKRPKNVKVGHIGTLDPFATGLLVLLIGKEYTRQAGQFSKADKSYEVTMRLGQISSTGDIEGELTRCSDVVPSKNQIEQSLGGFRGEISQVPPAYSAIKVAGVRSYKLARAGKEVILAPRKVTITDLKLESFDYPLIKFTADVSSGTYIRSLVSDIGESLGTGAYTESLRRTRINGWDVCRAVPPKHLNTDNIEQYIYI
ncbi:MAG TPA: tRNA pseudouridine(55) synthase TruB [Candidatus Saccharimonadales bacterium]|nr:tRNA pseudouridine(55) synthase TruB [Candidatus Saccharimonadales bacterium]